MTPVTPTTAVSPAVIEELRGPPAPELLARALCQRRGFSFLDSARPEELTRRAYSILAWEPFLTWRCTGDQVTLETAAGAETLRTADPLAHLRTLLARYAPGRTGERPKRVLSNPNASPFQSPKDLPFLGGAIGYFGYEAARVVPSEPANLPPHAPSPSAPPDAVFAFYDGLIVYDLAAQKTYAVANPIAQRTAEQILNSLRAAVHQVAAAPAPRTEPASQSGPTYVPAASLTSNLTRPAYFERIKRAQEYIAAGDIYQVNLSQRFELATPEDPFAIYRRLRSINPAPFGAYLNLGAAQILSSSPELLARIDRQGHVHTRPIKGTRSRGPTAEEDRALSTELLESTKDQAELLMIVDLLRSDLGRVCRYGSIHVDERYRVESHPTVFHLVATISGLLAPDRDALDCLRSLLPGGSITGAPKIRAMQIIRELEPDRRGVYTGAIGYLGFDGTCTMNIAIRTIICAAGRASYHVGGGIVADSDPESEYQETLAKGRALAAALLGPSTA